MSADFLEGHFDLPTLDKPVLRRWLEDAVDRGIYGPPALTGIRSKLDRLRGLVDDLFEEVQILKPPERLKM